MLENGIAFDAIEELVAKREVMRVGNNVDTRDGEEIKIHITGDGAAWTFSTRCGKACRHWITKKQR